MTKKERERDWENCRMISDLLTLLCVQTNKEQETNDDYNHILYIINKVSQVFQQ